jgi:probable rRNA maturation factor
MTRVEDEMYPEAEETEEANALEGEEVLGDPVESDDSETGVTSPIYLRPFRIDVTVRPGVSPVVSRHRLGAAVRVALEVAGAPSPASIGIVLSGDDELAELNSLHMGHSGPTDVLSFPFFPPEAYPQHDHGVPIPRDPWVAAALKQAFALPPGLRAHLGDVIISVERAVVQASEGRGGQTSDVRWTPAEEMILLAVHGTLHVCGWDHAEPVEETEMRDLERRVLRTLAEHAVEHAAELAADHADHEAGKKEASAQD